MNRLKNHTDELYSRLKKHLKEYAKEGDVETLHRIRVEIKKIKAVIQLVNANEKGFHGHKSYIPLRVIFRAAGKIREPELLYALLLRYKIEIENAHIPDEEKQTVRSRQFTKKIPGFVQIICDQKAKLDKHVRGISKSEIKKYLKKKKKALRLRLRGEWSERSLHKARKTTKEIVYVGAILRKSSKGSASFFDRLQDLLGQWHDRQILLPVLVRHKSPEIRRLKEESEDSVGLIRRFVSDYYNAEKK